MEGGIEGWRGDGEVEGGWRGGGELEGSRRGAE